MVNQFGDAGTKIEFAYKQMLERVCRRFYIFKETENITDFTGQALVGGKDGQVRVYLGCFFVEIAGSQVCVHARVAVFHAPDERELGVYLHTGERVVHPNAGFFHFFTPFEVGGFIKPGLNFNKNRHMFASFHRFHQRLKDTAVACHAVLYDFDMSHIRISSSSFKEINNGIE